MRKHVDYGAGSLKLQANDQTRFNINSMTKGVVAALTSIEIAKGTLLWSTNIKEAIPEFSCKDSVVEGDISVAQMGNVQCLSALAHNETD